MCIIFKDSHFPFSQRKSLVSLELLTRYTRNTMVIVVYPSRFFSHDVEFDQVHQARNCYGMQFERNYRKSPLWRSATRDRSPLVESLVHVLDFSRSDSIIIHPSPPSARLNYPGLQRATKDGSRAGRLLLSS